MLSQQGIVMTPGLLDKPLHLPGGEANLERNMQVLQEMGMEGWQALDVGGRCPVGHAAFARDKT